MASIAEQTEMGGGIGPNAANIRKHGFRVIRARMPMAVRRELQHAVKVGYLVRLPKDGMKPEVFCDPRHVSLARVKQAEEAIFALESIAKAVKEVCA